MTNDIASRPISPREKEVIQYIALGIKQDAIALKMGVTRKTVSKYRTHIGMKLNASCPAVITHYALHMGWVENLYERPADYGNGSTPKHPTPRKPSDERFYWAGHRGTRNRKDPRFLTNVRGREAGVAQ